jgi:hypothetical protein
MKYNNKIYQLKMFDFDEASKEWRKNKVNCGKGYFKYKCEKSNCNEILYCYTTSHQLFKKFASDFDLQHQSNPKRFTYCEEHLLSEN